MAAERLIKRTVWEADCPCGEKTMLESEPPKAKLCKCGKWLDFKEVIAIGPDFGLKGYQR